MRRPAAGGRHAAPDAAGLRRTAVWIYSWRQPAAAMPASPDLDLLPADAGTDAATATVLPEPAPAAHLADLNPEQRAAAEHDGERPLLIIAGAGSGKTNTLAHRVAHRCCREPTRAASCC